MKRFITLTGLGIFLGACSFAPLTVAVDDFSVQAGSSGAEICYTQVAEPISVDFASVAYEGDATYTPGQGIGDNSTVTMAIFGRASDPDPDSSAPFKCAAPSAEDILLADDIVLEAGVSQRIRAGGAQLAGLVTQDEYWLGASLNDDSVFSFPGRIDFTGGVIKANF